VLLDLGDPPAHSARVAKICPGNFVNHPHTGTHATLHQAWAQIQTDPPDSKEPTMAHTRIRKFNTSDTYPEQKLDNDLCQAVVTTGGKTVYLRGQCPQNLDDAVNIDSHDPVEQTHKVMQNIKQLIEECGGSMEHLVKVVVYITDVRHREDVYRTMGEYIKGVHPVSTGLVVQALARPDWLVEIDGTAVIPD
jgi:enamine deaminase RidA (YjgF/YER057c/UK114 family)